MRDVIQGFFPTGLPRIADALRTLPPAQRTALRTIQRHAAKAFELPPAMSRFATSGGHPLPPDVRQKMESLFRTNFADVRIHVGSAVSSLGALAFTHGSDIHFAPAQYDPTTLRGQRLLGHELTHVVQQRAGRVRNPFGSGVAVVQDALLEAEAERMAIRTAAHQVPQRVEAARSLQCKLPNGLHSHRIFTGSGPGLVCSVPAPPVLFRRHGSGGPVQCSMDSSSSTKKTSGLANTDAKESGQIYGIWKNEEYPDKIEKSSLTAEKCLYVGKTARGEDLGSRFVEHCKNDKGCGWCIDQGTSYNEKDHETWPYVVRNLWTFNGLTKLDVAVAEQYYIEFYISKGAKLANARNEITPEKFAELEDCEAFTTKKSYNGWKPKGYKNL